MSTNIPIPEEKWYQFLDKFTRIDELLETVIKELQLTNELLKIIATGRGVVPAPTLPTVPTTPTQPIQFQKSVTTIPAKIRFVTIKRYDLSTTEYTEVPVLGDGILFVADQDVTYTVVQGGEEFPVLAYTYTVFYLADENQKLYFKANVSGAKLYVVYFELVE